MLRSASRLVLSPGDPLPYLETYHLVTFYGSPPGAALGVLGARPRDIILEELWAFATQYQAYAEDRVVLPTYHLVVTIADPWPGRDGDYNHWMDETTMEEWLDAAQEAGVAVILDIQPGYADVLDELERLRRYLYRPHVHLALDSEFTMSNGGIPGVSLGQIGPAQINPIQAELDEIAREIGLNKVLILHQFDPSMLVEKEGIVDYGNVELVVAADGFGSPRAKTDDYLQYASEPGFEYGGFKLFFEWDWPLMAPSEVMTLEPVPAIIIYQ